MSVWLYRLRPVRPELLTAPSEAEIAAVGAHFAHLQRLTAAGVVLLAGRTTDLDPEGMGIVIFRAADEAEARQRMAADPAVIQGAMTAKLFPYRVALVDGAALEEARDA